MELSIFVDESGDFGEYQVHSPYYIISMIFHNQIIDISTEIKKLNKSLKDIGYGEKKPVHTEPLIRREDDYKNFEPNERRAIFTKLFYFTIGCEITYKSFVYKKLEYRSEFELEAKMAKNLSRFIQDNYTYFQGFDRILLYYDNGQYQLTRVLNAVFATHFTNYEIRKVIPSEYRLFQAADLICTLELLRAKTQHQDLTKSEKRIFHSKRDLNKDFLKGI